MQTKNTARYIEAIGRRKNASARVRITPSTDRIIEINGRPLAEYFSSATHQSTVLEVFDNEETLKYRVSAKTGGGGLAAQADAIRLGIARALVKESADRRVPLKRAGYLKRDPRSKERKKFGLRKARKAPQWSKR